VPSKIATVKAGQLVRLEGAITDVPNRIDGPDSSPLALIRFQAIAPMSDESGSGLGGDKTRAVPFKLQDETGTIWVDPQGLDEISLGPGVVPASLEVAEAAVIQTGLNPIILQGGGSMHIWELRGGQRLTVIGTVAPWEGGLVVKKLKKDPLVVTSLLGSQVQLETGKQVKTAWIYTALLGIPGLLLLLCGLGAAVANLVSVLVRR
ncbi:MAG: hypothetical protein HGB17_12435, partial [Syntrophobacteraceae bacterium]|nr:hypothetical protein [Syntrophobacteraceae bacterium]